MSTNKTKFKKKTKHKRVTHRLIVRPQVAQRWTIKHTKYYERKNRTPNDSICEHSTGNSYDMFNLKIKQSCIY